MLVNPLSLAVYQVSDKRGVPQSKNTSAKDTGYVVQYTGCLLVTLPFLWTPLGWLVVDEKAHVLHVVPRAALSGNLRKDVE